MPKEPQPGDYQGPHLKPVLFAVPNNYPIVEFATYEVVEFTGVPVGVVKVRVDVNWIRAQQHNGKLRLPLENEFLGLYHETSATIRSCCLVQNNCPPDWSGFRSYYVPIDNLVWEAHVLTNQVISVNVLDSGPATAFPFMLTKQKHLITPDLPPDVAPRLIQSQCFNVDLRLL